LHSPSTKPLLCRYINPIPAHEGLFHDSRQLIFHHPVFDPSPITFPEIFNFAFIPIGSSIFVRTPTFGMTIAFHQFMESTYAVRKKKMLLGYIKRKDGPS